MSALSSLATIQPTIYGSIVSTSPLKLFFLISGVVVVCALLAAALYRWWRQRHQTFAQWGEIQVRQLRQYGEQVENGHCTARQFFLAYTTLIKQVFGRAYNQVLVDKTDAELTKILTQYRLPAELCERLVTLLEQAEQVKFADTSSLVAHDLVRHAILVYEAILPHCLAAYTQRKENKK